MLNKTSIENIKGLFYHKTEDMPRISSLGARPKYSSLHNFQDKLNNNAMSIPDTEFGHLALVVSPTNFYKSNNYTTLVKPQPAGDKPTTKSRENTNPFRVQESIKAWSHKDQAHQNFRQVRKTLKAQILKAVNASIHSPNLLPTIPQ